MATSLGPNGSSFPTTPLSNYSLVNDSGWLDICVVGSSKGYIAPIGGDAERMWNPYLLGVLYFLGLCWCFLGVSIIADIFMLAIEKITSVDRIVTRKDGTKVRVRTWNDTVANLTLMAMGSSAPEILLNVIEITGASFFSGDLGPSTVVGSAAFNLLIINAFCTFAIAKGEVRKVKEVGVYALSSTCSILAYVWLVVILMAITPDVVTTWEAAVTFSGFPLLVIFAYLLDTKKCGCANSNAGKSRVCCGTEKVGTSDAGHFDVQDVGVIKSIAASADLNEETDPEKQRQAVAQILREVRSKHQSSSRKAAVHMTLQEIVRRRSRKSRAYYRLNATRSLTGHGELDLRVEQEAKDPGNGTVGADGADGADGAERAERAERAEGGDNPQAAGELTAADPHNQSMSALVASMMEQLEEVVQSDEEAGEGGESSSTRKLRQKADPRKNLEQFHFSQPEYSVLESTQEVQVLIKRPPTATGNAVHVVTRDGSASAESDYVAVDEILYFDEGQDKKTFKVTIVQDNVYEESEVFYIDLLPVEEDANAGMLVDVESDSEKSRSNSPAVMLATGTPMKMASLRVSTSPKNSPKSTPKTSPRSPRSPRSPSQRGSPVGSPRHHSRSSSPFARKPKRLDTATIHIIDDSAPGILVFATENYVCCESDKKVTITVTRKSGSQGKVSCKVKTVDREAVSPDDYIGIDEDDPMVLNFDEGETTKTFDIEIIDDQVYEKDESFDVVLFDAEGGAALGDRSYENNEVAANVVIISDEKERKVVDQMAQLFAVNYGRIRIGSQKYSQQFVDAVYPGGNRDCKAKPHVWILYIFALPWRLLFAIIPPTDLAGGWITFFFALGGIAGSTMIMADLAGLLGCVVGLPPAFTAISFVAVGTSIPDLFASMNAARADEYADASIGNVMGSNSVNVFMGLGLPWLMAAVYWDYFAEGETIQLWAARYEDITTPNVREGISEVLGGERDHAFFIVPANDLGFSVGVFCGVAVICLLVFGLRRHYAGGELGGPTASKCVGGWSLLFLWGVYITLSGLQVFNIIQISEGDDS